MHTIMPEMVNTRVGRIVEDPLIRYLSVRYGRPSRNHVQLAENESAGLPQLFRSLDTLMLPPLSQYSDPIEPRFLGLDLGSPLRMQQDLSGLLV